MMTAQDVDKLLFAQALADGLNEVNPLFIEKDGQKLLGVSKEEFDFIKEEAIQLAQKVVAAQNGGPALTSITKEGKA